MDPQHERPAVAGSSGVFLWNPGRAATATISPPSRLPMAFHRRLPGYRPTRLVSLDALAADLNLDHLWLKDEAYRLGLPAFKILGVSWGTYRLLSQRLGAEPDWQTADDLREAFARIRPLTLVTATAGNHGRALARVARWFGCGARIFVPAESPPGRVRTIAAEGAEITVVAGTYDDAVDAAAAFVTRRGSPDTILISDTATEPADQVPTWIAEGYSTMFWEIEDDLAGAGEQTPDLVIVQIGVGALASAAASHFRRPGLDRPPALIGVEPLTAACLLESARTGSSHSVPGPHVSAMYCLNAGRPSSTALAPILSGFDAFLAADDRLVGPAAVALAEAGVVAGPTGTAGLVGLRESLPRMSALAPRNVLLINTEGAADAIGYRKILQLAE
jgi:diaminopropionate ammonia-lyase